MIEKEKREALEWYIQFANMALDTLGAGDKAKLLIESREYLFSYHPIIEADEKRAEGMRWERGDFILEKTLPSQDSPAYWGKIDELQKTLRARLEIFLEPRSAIQIPGISGGRMQEGMPIQVLLFWDEKFHLRYIPYQPGLRTNLDLKLFSLLDNLPHSIIQKCEECGKFHLNPTRRKKKFCSPRCLWRFNAQERRKELKKHPKEYKAYLKKQREIMRKRYEDKRKATLGAKVKVGKGREK